MNSDPNNIFFFFYAGDFQGLEQTYGSNQGNVNSYENTPYSSNYNNNQVNGVNYSQGSQQPYQSYPQNAQNSPYNYNPYNQNTYNGSSSPYPSFQQPYQNNGYVNNMQFGMPIMIPVNNTPGFILGLTSIIICEMPFIGLICSIIGLILSVKSKSESNKPGKVQGNLVIPGIVCSIIGLVLSLLVTVVIAISLISFINGAADSLNDYNDYGNYGYYDDYNWGGGEAT